MDTIYGFEERVRWALAELGISVPVAAARVGWRRQVFSRWLRQKWVHAQHIEHVFSTLGLDKSILHSELEHPEAHARRALEKWKNAIAKTG